VNIMMRIRQGFILLPMLFILGLNSTMRELLEEQRRGIIWWYNHAAIQDLKYANEIRLLSYRQNYMCGPNKKILLYVDESIMQGDIVVDK
jgi:hypothetical protein